MQGVFKAVRSALLLCLFAGAWFWLQEIFTGVCLPWVCACVSVLECLFVATFLLDWVLLDWTGEVT